MHGVLGYVIQSSLAKNEDGKEKQKMWSSSTGSDRAEDMRVEAGSSSCCCGRTHFLCFMRKFRVALLKEDELYAV